MPTLYAPLACRPAALLHLIALLLIFSHQLQGQPSNSNWKDATGTPILGEPVEILGPLALFRTAKIDQPRRVLLSAFDEADSRRLYQAIASRPVRSDSWENAAGALTGPLASLVKPANRPGKLQDTPEPELLILVFGYETGKHPIDLLLINLMPLTQRMERLYPGRFAVVFWGNQISGGWFMGRKPKNWYSLSSGSTAKLPKMENTVPSNTLALVLATREGIPLIRQGIVSLNDVTKFCDATSNFLWQLNPENPNLALSRATFLQATRPLQFASSSDGPLLLYNRLKIEALRKHNVFSVNARFSLDETGAVTAIDYLDGTLMPQKIQDQLTPVFKQSAKFLPAIDHGKAIPSSYNFTLNTDRSTSQPDPDAAWLNGSARQDLPLKNWLVLQTIPIPTMSVTGETTVKADGTVQLAAVSIGDKNSKKSQRNAFNSDWFDEVGASTVQPKLGDTQLVDGEEYKWRRLETKDGLCDLRESAGGDSDRSIAYAYTEIDSPEDTDAWLGIGSDDGVKVWINGQLIIDDLGHRMSLLDDNVAQFRLFKGKNALLLKVQNGLGPWSFIARLRLPPDPSSKSK